MYCVLHIFKIEVEPTLSKMLDWQNYFKKETKLNNIKIFARIHYTHIPKSKRSGKVGPRAQINIMTGYSHNFYRLWNPIAVKKYF